MQVWVLTSYENGSYESIVNHGVTDDESAAKAWEARTTKDYSHWAEEFTLNAEPKR